MAMNIMLALETLRDRLATVAGVTSCKIGLESNITPDDYPIIRVVPGAIKMGSSPSRRVMDVLIYFGMPIQPFDDTPDAAGRIRMEKLYAALLGMEQAILALPRHGNGYIYSYQETVTDEDRLDTYKLMAIKMVVEG